MAPIPFSQSSFPENLVTSLVPIHKTSVSSDAHSYRNLVNNSTRTDVQNILSNSILQAKKEFEDFTKSQRNVFSNNFTNQLNKHDFGINKSFKDANFMEPLNNLQILRKGPFFQDQFFEECRLQFEKSVQDVVSKFGLSSSINSEASNNSSKSAETKNFMNDAFKSYRNLRDTQLREENQAASIEHGDHQHKIVIDVKDFMSGDVKIKSFNNTIRIEGHQENSKQSPKNKSSSKRNFCREFTLPGPVNIDSVSSTMSSDGILTITVPRSQPASVSTSQTSSFPNSQPESVSKSQPESTTRVTFPGEYNMTQSPSKSERYVTINELQPCDGQTDSNGATPHSYITYPAEVEGVSCHSYSRRPNGGYWKRY
ncbi:unnamed protein product, partial [Meganyctiphanes norvegica]